WWYSASKGLRKDFGKELNSLIFLVAWEIWKHRNDCVFNGASLSVALVLQTVANESAMWCEAGARGLYDLLPRLLIVGT
ncbi:hypothetical protein SETIT_5G034700v2, partial [Setaria italica]